MCMVLFDARWVCCGDPSLHWYLKKSGVAKLLQFLCMHCYFKGTTKADSWEVSLVFFLGAKIPLVHWAGLFIPLKRLFQCWDDDVPMALLRSFFCLTARWLPSLPLTPQQAPNTDFISVLYCGWSISCCHQCVTGLGLSRPAVGWMTLLQQVAEYLLLFFFGNSI